MRLHFVIPRRPISVNQAYARAGFSGKRGAGGGKGLVLTSVGRDYKDAVRSHAIVAAKTQGWPDPEAVTRVSVEIITWNTRHDADAACKLTIDSMQGVVFVNDRVVRAIRASKDSDESKKPRVEVIVTLDDKATTR